VTKHAYTLTGARNLDLASSFYRRSISLHGNFDVFEKGGGNEHPLVVLPWVQPAICKEISRPLARAYDGIYRPKFEHLGLKSELRSLVKYNKGVEGGVNSFLRENARV